MKFVHGRVRLATASPRVGEYDYGTKTYEPADYYGDHFMYRDDPNLLPVKKGLYASFSPTPSQNALTAFPPQTLYSPHSKSYSQNWSPLSGVCKPCTNMGYLGSSDVMTDEEAFEAIEAMEEAEEGEAWWQKLGSAIGNAWNSLSEEQQDEIINAGVDYAMSGDAQGAASASGLIVASQLSDSQLKSYYEKAKNKQTPFVPSIIGNGAYKAIKASLLAEMIVRGFISPLMRRTAPGAFTNLVSAQSANVQSVFCKAFPTDPKCQSKSSASSGDGDIGVGKILLGLSAVALIAKVVL